MKREIIFDILKKYLEIYPNEKERQTPLYNYLLNSNDSEICDWNNFKGHIVSGGFIYAIKEKKFLVLFHKDLKMYLYPGGHTDMSDDSPLITSKREIHEETGLTNFKQLKISDSELVPIDIDTHFVEFNKNKNIPEHYHFDFRYIFTIDEITNIIIDTDESANYKWVDIDYLYNDSHYGTIANKIDNIISKSINNI